MPDNIRKRALFATIITTVVALVFLANSLVIKQEADRLSFELDTAKKRINQQQDILIDYENILDGIAQKPEQKNFKIVIITPHPEQTEEITEETKEISRQNDNYSDEDLNILARIITAEAGAESYNCKIAVGQVVLNRAKKYKMSIKKTVFQKNTSGVAVFTPTQSGSYYSVKVDRESFEIAEKLLDGYVFKPVGKSLYFVASYAYKRTGWHYTASHGSDATIKFVYKTDGVLFFEDK